MFCDMLSSDRNRDFIRFCAFRSSNEFREQCLPSSIVEVKKFIKGFSEGRDLNLVGLQV